jgi:hypothetical protein
MAAEPRSAILCLQRGGERVTRHSYLLGVGLILLSVSVLSGQSARSTKLTLGVRGGLAFPRVALGPDSTYQGDVQVSWQADFGVEAGRRMTLGLEVVHNSTPGFAGDCPSKCSPSPDYTALSARVNWAPTRGASPAAVLLSAGAGLYRVHGDYGPAQSTEFGDHAVVELQVFRLQRALWLAPALRGDAVPGVTSSGLYVISLTLGFRYWGL